MRKRFLSFLLALCFTLPLLSAGALAAPSTSYAITGMGADDVVAVAIAQEGKRRKDFGYIYDWCAYFSCWAGRTAGQNFPDEDLPTPLHVAQW